MNVAEAAALPTRAHEFVCRMCGSPELGPVFTGTEERFGLGGEFAVKRCRSCGVVSTALPSGFPLEDWYAAGYWQDDPPRRIDAGLARILPHSALVRLRLLWRRFDGNVRPADRAQAGLVLDIGCGAGADTEEMQIAGARCIGLDTSVRGLGQAAERGLPVVLTSVDPMPFRSATFDTVVMSQVLEHLPEPRAALDSVARVLKPGGRLLVMLPNLNSIQRGWFDTHWANWHLPYHLWHLDSRALLSLLETSGFDVQSVSCCSPGSWFLISLGLRFPWIRPLLGNVFVSKLVQAAIAPALRISDRIGRGDCLVAEASPRNAS